LTLFRFVFVCNFRVQGDARAASFGYRELLALTQFKAVALRFSKMAGVFNRGTLCLDALQALGCPLPPVTSPVRALLPQLVINAFVAVVEKWQHNELDNVLELAQRLTLFVPSAAVERYNNQEPEFRDDSCTAGLPTSVQLGIPVDAAVQGEWAAYRRQVQAWAAGSAKDIPSALSFWQDKQAMWPCLASRALRTLASPLSAAVVERKFATLRDLQGVHRHAMSQEYFHMEVFLSANKHVM
jgi:hypothetical protein